MECVNHLSTVQVANQIALKIVQVRAKRGGNHFPFSIVTKNFSVSNDGDNLARLWVSNVVLRHASPSPDA
jgi:hypothetical protein